MLLGPLQWKGGMQGSCDGGGTQLHNRKMWMHILSWDVLSGVNCPRSIMRAIGCEIIIIALCQWNSTNCSFSVYAPDDIHFRRIVA